MPIFYIRGKACQGLTHFPSNSLGGVHSDAQPMVRQTRVLNVNIRHGRCESYNLSGPDE